MLQTGGSEGAVGWPPPSPSPIAPILVFLKMNASNGSHRRRLSTSGCTTIWLQTGGSEGANHQRMAPL
ncbi:MAG: hypothetical protein ACK4LB_00070 [Spirosomataceae bacterium]